MRRKYRGKGSTLPPLPHKFRGLTLDEFQVEAIMRLRQGTSVIVSAPTGTGKTLIADYLVSMVLEEGQRVIYTGPIKALVNQKYRDFGAHVGREKVGIMTGDLSINPQASVVVMTTEIFRNILLRESGRLADVAWVIFDEIHYLDHEERGTVWEEALLFMPPNMRLLGLSATVPNAREIGAWIQQVQDDAVAVIQHGERAVPLEHLFFNRVCQAVPRDHLLRAFVGTVGSGRDELDMKGGTLDFTEVWDSRKARRYRDRTSHLDLVQYVARNRLFPCLFFVFSRRGCEEKAAELAKRRDFLQPRERETVRVTVKRTLEELHLKRQQIPDIERLEEQWGRGIAVHHAGLLPAVRRIVEVLLERRVLRVVYATETFAVGVNMPVRCVCFESLHKYDGVGYRPLTQQEYFQMAGRAGRRGADRQGTAISLVDFSVLKRAPLPEWDESSLEPIRSRMQLTFNMTANMAAQMSDTEVKRLLAKTLASYQENKRGSEGTSVAECLFEDYLQRKKLLRGLGYMQGDELSEKGQALRSVYVKDLLLTELLHSSFLADLSPSELAGLAAALLYEDPSPESFPLVSQPWIPAVAMIAERLMRITSGAVAGGDIGFFPPVAGPVRDWAMGQDLVDVLHGVPMQPGDLVTLCRQVIDLLRQMVNARPDNDAFVDGARKAMEAVDRDVVKVHL